jgi:hypothetical protein
MFKVAGALDVPFPTTTELGVIVQLALALVEEHVRFTVPLKPFVLVIASAVLVGCPPATLNASGVEATRKLENPGHDVTNCSASTEPRPVTWS